VGEASLSVDALPELPATVLGAGVHLGTYVTRDDDDVERAARIAYDEILRTTREGGFPHLIRVWNYVRDINAGEGEVERYKRFCAGRHDAFDAAGWRNDQLPAASAVGIRERGLVIHYLAAREPGRQIENPRQVSAYAYPPQYGRRSPSFARATLFGETLFIAGTASIAGHETRHAGDVRAQLDETLLNIDTIAHAAGRTRADLTHVKLYLRNSGDAEIAKSVAAAMPGAKLIVVEADICRRELLLEIEAIG